MPRVSPASTNFLYRTLVQNDEVVFIYCFISLSPLTGAVDNVEGY